MPQDNQPKDNSQQLDNLLGSLLPPPGSNDVVVADDTDATSTPDLDGGAEPAESGQSDKDYYYEPEEFSTILEKNPLDIDPERVPNELMPAYKAAIRAYKNFQADYTRKTQDIAAQKEQKKPSSIYEAYEIDPDGVMGYLNTEITKARDDGDLEKVNQLVNLKADIIEKKVRKFEQMTQQDRHANQVLNVVRQEIPDIDKKAPLLTEFAIKELGLTQEEITSLTDPSITGYMAAKMTIAINRLYDKLNVGKKIAGKEVKPQPPRLGNAGEPASGEPTFTPEAFYKMSSKDFDQLLKKVQSNIRS